MRYVTFVTNETPPKPRLGALTGEWVIDLAAAQPWAQSMKSLPAEPLPGSLLELILAGPGSWAYPQALVAALGGEDLGQLVSIRHQPVARRLEDVRLLPPLPRPMGLRDFYAFEAHVAQSFANRGAPVPEAWYRAPMFYFSNPNAVYGPDETIAYPRYSQELDYELEVACVIGQAGRNIPAERASVFIFGYMIFNDWSARDVQREEMSVGLGPAKGKDFASSFGPCLVTLDELEDRRTDRPGVFDLEMTARVNGEERSRGNWKDIHYSFAEMIERASEEVFLLPGEILGSGTVGTGCLLELTQGKGPWLAPGDEVELEIDRIGMLRNTVGEASGS
jgi:2-keto-4-pentenoate hydratase/2-oxohepta-3-ene-1,7-dioic acid hydratase in catechol pathway